MAQLLDPNGRAKAKSGLAHYLWEIRRFPILEPHEEYVLAKRWRELGDQKAAHKLINSHLRLAAKVARQFGGHGLSISDLISEGNIGLLQALKRFDPDKGFRFATYAVWWVKATIHEYILRSRSLVNVANTPNRKRLFFNLHKAKRKILAFDQDHLQHDQVESVAERLGVTARDVINMNGWLGGDASLNTRLRNDRGSAEWQDALVDDTPNQETILAADDELQMRHKMLVSALSTLNQRERRIFEARRLAEEPVTLTELADEFGVTRERVRQIGVCAFEKVQKAMKNGLPSISRFGRSH